MQMDHLIATVKCRIKAQAKSDSRWDNESDDEMQDFDVVKFRSTGRTRSTKGLSHIDSDVYVPPEKRPRLQSSTNDNNYYCQDNN